ncbi:hypothetical protein VCSRO209_1614 [Vibrio cholerae]|nr:hypothetical protein [Vibrio cholerae]EGR0380290.1 hypothetical protein [Vibrio cholerae]EGR2106081.1 hypothetical protein [Vibrio cholerae]EGR2122185.1 hypothetical protein [Vibrio cholerae]MVB15509.1 hypothetical protein [Vibrio cholerae]
MKKILMLLVLILGLGGAGAGFYLFYLKPQMDAEAAKANEVPETAPETPAEPTPAIEAKPEIMDFYVDAVTLSIRDQPDPNAYPDVDKQLYRGDKVHLLEKKGGWGRISDYYVYEDGGPEVAEWIPLEGLTVEPPVITPEERTKTLTGYIESSDDFLLHQEKFLTTTDTLLKEGNCSPKDFEELGGWVRSVTFGEQPVYFIYCGGLSQAHKIYLNVQTGQIFYR